MRPLLHVCAAAALLALWAGCDSSTATPANTKTDSPVPVVRVGTDTTLILDGASPTTIRFTADSGFEYSVTTVGSIDTRVQLLDSAGNILSPDARPDSLNGLAKFKASRQTTVVAVVTGTGTTVLRLRLTGGPDSLEALDARLAGVSLIIGATPNYRTLGTNDTDWFSFEAKTGVYYRIRSESDSNVLIQAWDERQPRNSETGKVNVILAPKDTTIRIRVRLASKGQAGYGLFVAIDSTTFAKTETNTYYKPYTLEPGSGWVAFYANSRPSDYFRIPARPGRPYRLIISSDVAVNTELCSDTTGRDCNDGYDFVLIKPDSKGVIQATVSANTYYRDWIAGEYLVRVDEDSSLLDKYEPNDSRETAQDLDSGITQTHLLSPFDRDWARFRVDSGVSYLVETNSSITSVSLHADSMFRVTDNVSTAGFKSRVTGWAWAEVTAFLGREDSGSYKISYSIDRRTDAHEPDDSRETAKPHAINAASPFSHALPVGDRDWISFETDSGKTYNVSVAASGSNSGFSSYIYCEVNTGYLAKGWASNYRSDPIKFVSPKTGTCFVYVQGEYTWNSGSYSIQIK